MIFVSSTGSVIENTIICTVKTIQMTTTSEYIEALRGYKTEKAELYGIARIGIFGSVARNEQNADSRC